MDEPRRPSRRPWGLLGALLLAPGLAAADDDGLTVPEPRAEVFDLPAGAAPIWRPSVEALYAPGLRARRRDFQAALEHLQAGRTERFETLRAQLADYPLAPYLDYYGMLRRAGRLDVPDWQAFRERHAQTPLPGLLRYYWLRQAARFQRWDVLRDVTLTPADPAEVRCRQAVALLRDGRRDEAFARAPDLWIVPRSQHEACDPLFEAWAEAGGITPAIAWARMVRVVDAGERRLARYLLRFFDEPHRADAELLQRTWTDPAGTLARWPTEPAAAPPVTLEAARVDVPVLAVERLARTRPEAALGHLRSLAAVLPEAAVARAELSVVRRLWLERSPELDGPLPISAAPLDETLALIGRAAVRRQDWSAVLELVERMPPALAGTSRWRYWRARALSARGRTAEGDALFFELADDRTFYGFLAAERVDHPLSMNDTGSPVVPERLAEVLALPATRRAVELMAIGHESHARREWQQLSARLDDAGRRALAHVARAHGWHRMAIQTAIDGELWDDLAIRFPVAWEEPLQAAARRHGLAPTWLLAIARQESALLPEARSPAGALGLMQLMPGTAVSVARSLGRSAPAPEDLRDPDVNVTLGAAYFAELLDEFGDNRALAAAAYNAGPHRVRRWLADTHDVPLDVWIEAIPFSETRGYVQNVLAFASIYAYRMAVRAPLTYPGEQHVAAPG